MDVGYLARGCRRILSAGAPVSVVIPCYNCADTVTYAVASVVNQTYRPKEVILVDDASSDNGRTPQVLEELQDRFGKALGKEWLKVIHRSDNGGPGTARNTGWDAATQPLVAFLDADDTWHPRKIEVQHEVMSQLPGISFSCHRYRILARRETPDFLAVAAPCGTRPVRPRALLFRNFIHTSTVMVRRSLPVRFPEKRYSEDYLLWLLLVLEGYRGVFIDAELTFRHKPPYGAGGLSGKLWRMEAGELENYWELHRRGKLSFISAGLLTLISLSKFARRGLIWAVRGGLREHETQGGRRR
jgi:glycosyltransferase involved in cell wall biosynthesis